MHLLKVLSQNDKMYCSPHQIYSVYTHGCELVVSINYVKHCPHVAVDL